MTAKMSFLNYYSIALFAVSVLVILLIPTFLVPNPSFSVDYSCYGSSLTSLYCNFSCVFTTKCPEGNISLRLFVSHTGWSGIFDKTFAAECGKTSSYDILLPRRDYNFTLRVSAYTNSSVGIAENSVLVC